MSQRETEMTLWFWQQVGGALYEEFRAVDSNQPHHTVRYLDGLIVLAEPTVRMERRLRPDIRDKDVVIVQTKNARLGMYLMGQKLFSLVLQSPWRLVAFRRRPRRAGSWYSGHSDRG